MEKMQIDKNVQFTFPNWQNILDTFKIIPFQDTTDGKSLLNQWENNIKIAKWIKKIGMIAASIVFMLVLIEDKFVKYFSAIVAGIFIFLIFYTVYKIYQKTVVRITQDRYFKKRNAFTFKLADVMRDYFRGHSYVFDNAHCFIYNQHMCIYINANDGSWVGYHRNNIKDVELEHKLLGSTTISNTSNSGSAFAWTNNFATYSGSSTTVSNTTTQYEWRLDIYTDFTDYPHLTIVFPENSDGETYAKKAKALLKHSEVTIY
jgi:hypothetical protein